MTLLVEIVEVMLVEVGVPFVVIAGDTDFDNQEKQETAAPLTGVQGTLSRVHCQPCIMLKSSRCSLTL